MQVWVKIALCPDPGLQNFGEINAANAFFLHSVRSANCRLEVACRRHPLRAHLPPAYS